MATHKRDIRTIEALYKNGMLEFSIKLMEDNKSNEEAIENLKVLEYYKEVINDTSLSAILKNNYFKLIDETIKKIKKSKGWT